METPNNAAVAALKIGDEVTYVSHDDDYWWSTRHARVVSVGDGVVVLYRELNRDEILDGLNPVLFWNPELVFKDGREAGGFVDEKNHV